MIYPNHLKLSSYNSKLLDNSWQALYLANCARRRPYSLHRAIIHRSIETLAGAALLGLPYVGLFLFRRGGAGDAKLMCGVGAWLGVVHGLAALLCISLAGAAQAVIWAIAYGRSPNRRRDDDPVVESSVPSANLTGGQEKAARTAAGETERAPGQLTIPYGVAILAGAWAWILLVVIWS